MIALLLELVRRCDEAEVPLTLCGEMAGRPLEAMALVGLGFRRLSMAPASFGPVKAMVRSLDQKALERYLISLIKSGRHSLRGRLRDFAKDHGVIT